MSRARKGMSPDQEPDPDLAAELRQFAGREWADEAAEDERLTELLRRRRMSLQDVIADLAHRGDRVSVDFGGHTFSGAVVAGCEDSARILGPGQVADIRLDSARWSILGPGDRPARSAETIESFMATLRAVEAEGATVRLAMAGSDVVTGQIEVVASDHVEMADLEDRRLYIPVEMILAAIRSTEFH